MGGRCYLVTLLKQNKTKKQWWYFSPLFCFQDLLGIFFFFLEQCAAECMHLVSKFWVLILTPFNINLAIVSSLRTESVNEGMKVKAWLSKSIPPFSDSRVLEIQYEPPYLAQSLSNWLQSISYMNPSKWPHKLHKPSHTAFTMATRQYCSVLYREL